MAGAGVGVVLVLLVLPGHLARKLALSLRTLGHPTGGGRQGHVGSYAIPMSGGAPTGVPSVRCRGDSLASSIDRRAEMIARQDAAIAASVAQAPEVGPEALALLARYFAPSVRPVVQPADVNVEAMAA